MFHRAVGAGGVVVERERIRGTAVAPESEFPEVGLAGFGVSERGGFVKPILDPETAETVRRRVEGEADAASFEHDGAGRGRKRLGRHPRAAVALQRYDGGGVELAVESRVVERWPEIHAYGAGKCARLPPAARGHDVVHELVRGVPAAGMLRRHGDGVRAVRVGDPASAESLALLAGLLDRYGRVPVAGKVARVARTCLWPAGVEGVDFGPVGFAVLLVPRLDTYDG